MRGVVPSPEDLVFKPLVDAARVNDGFNRLELFPINIEQHRRGRLLSLSLEGVCRGRAYKAGVECVVYAGELGRELQLIRVRVKDLANFKGAEKSWFKLLHWSTSGDVAAVQEYEVSLAVGRGRSAVLVGV